VYDLEEDKIEIISLASRISPTTPTTSTKFEKLHILHINSSHIKLGESLGSKGSAKVLKCIWSKVNCALKILQRRGGKCKKD